MKFSVIITAQDRPEVLSEVIAALPDVEIIVAYRNVKNPVNVVLVDCNDLPPTWQIGKMKNRGAELAIAWGATHLIFLDGDCVPQEGWLEAYEEAMQTYDLAIGRIDREEPDGTIKPDYRLSLPNEKRLDQGGGGNFCVATVVFDSGFDPAYDGGWGYEDSAFFRRRIEWGWVPLFCDARVIHKHHDRGPSHFEGLARNRRIYESGA